MDSFERVFSSFENKYVDRPPIFPHIGDHAGIIQGLTYDVMYKDAKKASKAHLKTLNLYGYDFIEIQVEPSFSVAEGCGAKVNYAKDKNPWIEQHVFSNEEDLEVFEVPDFMETQSTNALIKGTQLLAEENNAPVVAFMTGPLTFSLQLMDYNELLLYFNKKPEFVQKLISLSVRLIKSYIELLKDAGAHILMLCEHDAQMVAPNLFKEYCLNHLPELLKIYKYNILHMCGNIKSHLQLLKEDFKKLKGLNSLNVGSEVNIKEVDLLLDYHIGIAGNIDHIKLLPSGKPDHIKEAVKTAIEDSMGDYRFIVAPGCEITADTPTTNVKAFVDAVKTI
jgi:MtaA/CmuA family methyltransferase